MFSFNSSCFNIDDILQIGLKVHIINIFYSLMFLITSFAILNYTSADYDNYQFLLTVVELTLIMYHCLTINVRQMKV